MPMNENPDKRKRGKRRLIGIAGSFLSLIVLIYIAVMLISGRQSELFRFINSSSDRTAIVMADEYHFDVGRNRVFADLDGAVAAAGTLGIQVLDAGGSETLRDSFRMTEPVIKALEGRAVTFDIGGTDLRVFNDTGIIASIEAEGVVVSASINRNGWTAVCSQREAGTLKGVVAVYNSSGKLAYRVNMVTGYVLSAALSPDNKSLAILNLTDAGSRITFYNLDSEDAVRVYEMPGRLLLDIRYLTDGNVLAISTESLLVVDKNNEGGLYYLFTDRRLGGFVLDGDFITLYLLDYGVGHRGRLVTIGEDGSILGEIETDREIISLSSNDGILSVLRSDGLVFYDTTLVELQTSANSASVAGATIVLSLNGGYALVAGDHSAIVIRIES